MDFETFSSKVRDLVAGHLPDGWTAESASQGECPACRKPVVVVKLIKDDGASFNFPVVHYREGITEDVLVAEWEIFAKESLPTVIETLGMIEAGEEIDLMSEGDTVRIRVATVYVSQTHSGVFAVFGGAGLGIEEILRMLGVF